MLHHLLKEQSENKSKSSENERPPTSNHQSDVVAPLQKDDDDFVPVSHQDVADQDLQMKDIESPKSQHQSRELDEIPSSSPTGASLQRMPGRILDIDDDDDHSFLRPFMGHLHNRLLNRGAARSVSNKFDPLHPYTTVLSISDLEQCVRVEEEAFPEHERCSREKFIYRLTRCPELSLGFYSRPTASEIAKSTNKKLPLSPKTEAAKARDDKFKAATVKNAEPELIAHIVSTLTLAPCVTDESMDYAKDWQTKLSSGKATSDQLGHSDLGRTLCIHSLAVGKAHQRKSLGSTLLKAYIQRVKDSKIADRISLLAHGHLVKFYTENGFVDMGESSCAFGGGHWRNMIMEFGEETED